MTESRKSAVGGFSAFPVCIIYSNGTRLEGLGLLWDFGTGQMLDNGLIYSKKAVLLLNNRHNTAPSRPSLSKDARGF